ncbi:MAG: carboxylating nicotinate-nucleotide diphosphorylase [Caldilineaceae bacterium]|nr:carboxylating nicotinate-nucleotide diphosphorylase [Caldilineaceae bacterium]
MGRLMRPEQVSRQQMVVAIQRALEEDVGDGDVTTLCTVAPTASYEGTLIAKATGVVAGLEVAQLTFALVALMQGQEGAVSFTAHVRDGEAIARGAPMATVHGPGQILLTAERTALNFLQRMSGIATLTAQYVAAVQGTAAQILDTRKTVPGLRGLDKWAVALGGGTNHRHGLYDMVLIKENHVAAAGGISAAVAQVRRQDARHRPIEVEVRSLAELQEALPLGVDQIMLDNMDLAQMREAVGITNGAVPLEASGNVSLATVAAIAATGVDLISVGKLTHSVEAFDISFLLKEAM